MRHRHPVRAAAGRRPGAPRRRSRAPALGLAGLLLAAALPFLPAGCGSDSTDAPETGRLTGTVVLNLTDDALAGVTVAAGGRSQTTAADGAFAFDGLPRGPVELTAGKPDYRPFARTIDLGETAFVRIPLVPVDSTSDVGGVVRHRVDGPLPFAVIRCCGREIVSGPDGTWSAVDVPMGLHDVQVEKQGYLPLTTLLVAARPVQTLDLVMTRPDSREVPLTRDTELRLDLEDINTNYGTQPVAAAGARTQSEALLALPTQQDLGPVQAVERAILRLHVRRQFLDEPDTASTCLRVLVVQSAWSETGITGGMLDDLEIAATPLFDYTGSACLGPLIRPWTVLELDVTGHVAEIVYGWPHLGLLFEHVVPRGAQPYGGIEIATSDNPDPSLRPVLELDLII